MSRTPDDRDDAAVRDGQVGELLRLAGRRPAPDARHLTRARAAARAEWTRVVARRRWRLVPWISVTAVIVVTVMAVSWRLSRDAPPPAPRAEVATLKTIAGSAIVIGGDDLSSTLTTPGVRLRAGDRVETPSAGRALFVLNGGTSVSVDQSSQVRVNERGTITLLRGAVYVDAGPRSHDRDLQVRTPLGVVRHVGTQFEVRLDGDAVHVRVREGRVLVESSGRESSTAAGQALLLRPDRAPETRALATDDHAWRWTSDVAAPFQLEGSTLREFLEWVSRREGWQWQYAPSSLDARVDSIVLRGTIDGLTPEEALDAVLRTSGLTFQRKGSRLVVAPR